VGATVEYPAPTATDDCGPPTVACNPPSGSVFPPGCTTVNCIATDAAGNKSTCQFQVCVKLENPFGSPLLPPPNGKYISVPGTKVSYQVPGTPPIIISNICHSFFTPSSPPPQPGSQQIYQFGSQVDLKLSSDGGRSFACVSAPANVLVRLSSPPNVPPGASSQYDTEMLQLDISGGTLPQGTMIRESPTLAST